MQQVHWKWTVVEDVGSSVDHGFVVPHLVVFPPQVAHLIQRVELAEQVNQVLTVWILVFLPAVRLQWSANLSTDLDFIAAHTGASVTH
jgi:hypothetical protein